MAQPDASVVWIQYMAFLISLGEVEKARGLAERAVQTINYRWGKSHPDHCVPVPVVMQCSGFPGGAEEAGLTLQALNHRSGWLAALHVGCLWTAQWVCASWLLGHPPHAQELRQACIMLLVVDSHQKGMVYSGKQTTHDNSMPQAPCRQEREGCSWFPALSARPQTSAGMDCVPPWCRQEQEKFNIWVAWLNLESKYGDPTPEEALTRLFQRALTYCDQKKLYLALVDILDRTGQVRLTHSAAWQGLQPQDACWGPAGKRSACSAACATSPIPSGRVCVYQ